MFVRSYLELLGIVVDHNPVERGLPPTAKHHRICRVNVYLLPLEPHGLSIGGDNAPLVPQATPMVDSVGPTPGARLPAFGGGVAD
jgi:hypothetical protein